jgi:uncharacterized protein YndB with AHSA1/START domain
MTLAFSVDRTVEIRARCATVFRFFTDPARWARWWGEGSTIDPVVGGAVLIVYPGGERVSGVIREIVVDRRLVFSYGYEAAGRPIGPGGSLVTITLSELADGATRLELRHDVDRADTRDLHVQGWRHQLARFADVVADDAFAGARDAVTAWFASWNDGDADHRRTTLGATVSADVRFRDAHGDVYGLDELVNHVGAVLRFMPGLTLEMRGTVRRSHDVALADWAAVSRDGRVTLSGTNVFRFAADGRICDVIGVPSPSREVA